MTGTDLLRASGLCVSRGRREVLHDVAVHVAGGEIVAVLGPNGAGKSTLLAALGGALTPTAGSVVRSGRVASLMQSPGLASRSARANVELALAWWGVPRGARRARADDALRRMRATDLADRPAAQLSGGEQRRVHLARAVAIESDVLLLDEPFDGLDPQTHAELRDDAMDALRTSGAGVLIVLHDRADAWAVADRLVVLLHGRVAADGPPREVLATPPSPTVARFLGYDGELSTSRGVVLTRAANVVVDPSGPIRARVARVVVTEDAARVRLDTERGAVWGVDPAGTLRVGDEVGVRLDGAAEFATGVS